VREETGIDARESALERCVCELALMP